MYKFIYTLPDGTVGGDEVVSTHDALTAVSTILIDAGVEPRLARRFARHLVRQPPGTEITQQPTGWRFRIDQAATEEK